MYCVWTMLLPRVEQLHCAGQAGTELSDQASLQQYAADVLQHGCPKIGWINSLTEYKFE